MKEYKGSPALDAGLLAAAQAVEHYEISRYGTLKTWARARPRTMRSGCSTDPRRRKEDRCDADGDRRKRVIRKRKPPEFADAFPAKKGPAFAGPFVLKLPVASVRRCASHFVL